MQAQPEETPSAPGAAEGIIATAEVDKPGDPSTHFIFSHKIFTIENCKFSLNGADKMPCFYVPFDGAQVAAIELRKIQSEFNIAPDSVDAALLKKVEKGLAYLREIRPNDSIPREILDGSASWTIENHHKELAKCKINQELIFWMIGIRGDYLSLEEMQANHTLPENRTKVREAHKKLAALLNLPDAKAVPQRLGDIARETCYIEALRERSGKMGDIVQRLASFASAAKKESPMLAEIGRMQDLMRRASKVLSEKFARVDNLFRDMPKLVANYRMVFETVRTVRDDIHIELKKWDEYFILWAELTSEHNEESEKLFRNFYRFLAENYMEQQNWGSSGAQKKK